MALCAICRMTGVLLCLRCVAAVTFIYSWCLLKNIRKVLSTQYFQHSNANEEVVFLSYMFAQSRIAARSTLGMLTRSKFATMRENLKVDHQPQREMFILDVDGSQAMIQYQKTKDHITLQETLVPSELEGRGLGKVLAKEAFNYVAENNLRMKIECTFLQHYLEKYAPEYKKYQAKL